MQVQVLDFPQALPCKCYYCGYSGTDRKYLDTGISAIDYGAIIFCEQCMAHLGDVMGYAPPQIMLSLREQNEFLSIAVREQEQKILALESAINSLKAAGFYDGSRDDSNDSVGSVSSFDDNSDSTLSESDEVREGELGSERDFTTEPTDDEGMAVLRSGESEPNPFDL